MSEGAIRKSHLNRLLDGRGQGKSLNAVYSGK